eukprot:Nitzschia sp. Nitz4//scaffold53_size117307//77257//78378//NITZ4_003775-RA/size117307-processed-gene-0.36-mRNA-1//-1//CDS//3329554220//3551//frame0
MSSTPPEVEEVDVPVSEEERPSPPTDSLPADEPVVTENPPVVSERATSDDPIPATSEEVEVNETLPVVAPESAKEADAEASTQTTTAIETVPESTPDKSDVVETTTDSKLKFQYVKDADGKVSLQVAPAAPRSKTPKKSSKASSDRKSKRATSSRSRSPTTPTIPGKAGSSQTPKTPKPKMDLRHILAKHEKKKTPVAPAPSSGEVDFYGSMSAIPFLKPKATATPKKATATSKPRPRTPSSTKLAETPDLETTASLSPTPKPKLPTREEIVAEAQYDEAQLHLWKSMSALDSGLGDTERPADFLPMMPPTKSPKQKNLVSPVPANNRVRAFRRPDDYLNPDLKSPQQQRFLVHVNPEEVMQEKDILPLNLEK